MPERFVRDYLYVYVSTYSVYSFFLSDRPHSKVRLGNSRKVVPGHVESISGDEIADGFQKAYDSVVSRWGYSDLIWVACTDGKINSRAVEGGRTSAGEHMYVARAVSPGWTKCVGR